MALLFGVASFFGAALLFLIEPMLAKLVLPFFGGSPMVWNTCTLFFQMLLLVGYGYVHVSTRRIGRRRQPWLHLGLLLLPLLALPVGLPADAAPPPDSEPAVWLLRVLAVAAGLPFAILATTGPLLQRWFSWSRHHRADDPYFLYAASNAGSVAGLLGYPFLIEPTVGLSSQTRIWSLGYVGYALLVAACGVVSGLASRRAEEVADGTSEDRVDRPSSEALGAGPPHWGATDGPSWQNRLTWVAVAFVPSSLMLGVTTHVSTDIAPIPLFWTVPLAIYLATFVVAFARTTRTPPRTPALLACALVVPALLVVSGRWQIPVWLSVGLDLAVLTSAGLAAHGRLSAMRPSVEHLTGFYLLVSLGGALGGLLNGLVAPVVFDRPIEYSLVLATVPLLAGSFLALPAPGVLRTALSPSIWLTLTLLGTIAVVEVSRTDAVLRERTFFGSYRVVEAGDSYLLLHGTTTHGWEVERGRWAGQPTAYYARSGPIGDVMSSYGGTGLLKRVAVVGMGVGTMAAYGQPQSRFDFYEIDPAVVEIAEHSGYFDFVRRSKADVRVVVGDGRLSLAGVADGTYGLIAIDAFSSDAIPAHLLTEEALGMYRAKLAPHGLLAMHITNRHLRLAPVIAAEARHLGMAAFERHDAVARLPASASDWVVLARSQADLDQLRARPGWEPIRVPLVRAWTDDYSSLMQVLDVG